MKCSNTACGWQGAGNFCQTCGSKMMPDAPANIFIICSGTLDGLSCGSEIKQSQNFCTKCGTPVDKSQFAILQESCKGCGTVFGLDCMFCPECGLKKGSSETKDIPGILPKVAEQTFKEDSKQETPVSITQAGDNSISTSLNACAAKEMKPDGMDVASNLKETNTESCLSNTSSSADSTHVPYTAAGITGEAADSTHFPYTDADAGITGILPKVAEQTFKEDSKQETPTSVTPANDNTISGSLNACAAKEMKPDGMDVASNLKETNTESCLINTSSSAYSTHVPYTDADAGITDEAADSTHVPYTNADAGITGETADSTHVPYTNADAGITDEAADSTHVPNTNADAGITGEAADSTHAPHTNADAGITDEAADSTHVPFTDADAGITGETADSSNNIEVVAQGVGDTDGSTSTPCEDQYSVQCEGQDLEKGVFVNKVEGDKGKLGVESEITGEIDEKKEEIGDVTQNDKTVESHTTEDEDHLGSDDKSEIRDHEMLSDDFQESIDTISESSGCEDEIEQSAPKDLKRKSSGRGKKAESKRKREHKKKVHAEKFNLKKEQITESETAMEHVDNVRKEETVALKHSEQDPKECSDSTNFVFGINNQMSETDSTSSDSYTVRYPPDQTGPNFLFGTDKKMQNVQESRNSSDTATGDTKKVEGRKATDDCTSQASGIQETNFNETVNTRPDAMLGEQNKTQKDEKNKTEREQKNGDRQTNTSTQNNAAKSTQSNGNDKIPVIFHILVPTNVTEKNKHVVLVIGNEEFGGWNDTKLVLHTVRRYQDYEEMEVTVNMTKYHLQRYMKYKYAVIKDRSTKNVEWENYYCHRYGDKYHNRRLFVQPQMIGRKDEWHQYDGVVTLKPNENLFQKGLNLLVGKYEKDCEEYAKDFATRFCPAWFKSDFRLMDTKQTHNEAIDHLECLYNGLRKMYYVDSRIFQSEDEYATKFAEWIFLPLSNTLSRQETTTGEHCVRIIRALCIVVVCDKLNIPLLEQIWQNVCRCLLVHADTANKTCRELRDIQDYFPESKNLAKAVTEFIKRANRFGKNPSWMFCIPLIHVLEGICKPFEKLTTQKNHSDRVPKWWGIVEIKSAVESFKRDEHKWQISLTSILETMEPLFEMDYYLPRSIVACLKPFEVREIIGEEIIPVEVCCATVYCFIKETKPSYPSSDVSGTERTVIECITKLMNRLQGYSLPVGSSRIQWWLAFMIAFDSVRETVSTSRTFKVLHSAKVFLHCVSIYQRICNQSEDEKDKIETQQRSKDQELKETACDHVVSWLRQYAGNYWFTGMSKNLQLWNDAFVENLKDEEVGQFWNEQIANNLINTLHLQGNNVLSTFIEHYCKQQNDYCGLMQDCLDKFALSAVERGVDLDVLMLTEDKKKRFATLLSGMFQREWRSVDKGEPTLREDRILKMAVSWSPFRQFLKSTYNNENCRCCLSEDCRGNLEITITVLHTYVDSLLSGDIQIGTLMYIQKNKSIFCQVIQEVDQKRSGISKTVSKAVDIRAKEVQAFQVQADQMKALYDLCSHFPDVCLNDIHVVLQKQVNIEKYPVSEFCKTVVINENTKEEQYNPNVCAFNVPVSVYGILPLLKMYKRSLVFDKMWNKRISGVGQDCKTLEDIITLVWFPVKESCDQFVGRVDAGEILFQEFEEMIGHIYEDDDQGLLAELRKMNISDTRATRRLKQLKQFRKLGSCMKGAKVILAFARRYHLTGDFKAVADIAANHDKDFKMNSFDPFLMKTCEFLEEVHDKRTECLAAFLNSGNLIKWLKDTMHKLKELKVFVDLAFMSAGDEPLNVGKVQCLHSAVTGYAPLIFDLKPDSGYVDLLDLCKIIWKELDSNPKLPKMLIDTNRELEWLKDVEKAHGSVELTSFVQADAINSDGIYTVGRNVWSKDGKSTAAETSGGSLLLMEDILRLTVREQEGKRQKRDYTFTQLQDLTSRLMLVAGKAEKGNDNVEEFVMTYDGVTRLCNVYIQLCAAGCVLFQDWSVRCLCDAKRPVALILQFGQGEGVPSIKGRRSKQEELKDMVPALAKFMEHCLKEWLQHIKDKRKLYVHLNFFTVDQLVILQRELMKVGTEDQPSHLIYPLLSAVRQNFSPADLIEAMAAAKEEIDHQNTNDSNDSDESVKEADQIDANTVEEERRVTFVKELMNAGYNEALAVKALEHVDLDDVSQGIVWCMEHEESVEDDSESSDKKEDPPVETRSDFRGWSQSETSLQAMITTSVSKLTQQNDGGSRPLLTKLSELWERFLASITSNICDYLSLEHLGLILKHLADKDTVHIERTLPANFSEGQPNLIVCPSDDVIVTALCVYTRDRDQPLPQSDEILMCTTTTTKDEVDIFWRRAIFGRSKKIHCLVNADLLDYEVSEASEKCLEEYLQEAHVMKDLKYRLLVICGSDNEYRSTIVSSLDKHRKQPLPANLIHLRQYIASKLNIQFENTAEMKPAAFVDHERSSVRLIKSWRAGVGKTLFKQRQEEKLMGLNRTVESVGISIPLHEKTIDMNYLIHRLLEHTLQPEEVTARLFHIDVSHEVENGVDYLLFNLLILGCLTDKTGFVWRKSPTDIYLIETLPLLMQATNRKSKQWKYVHSMLNILPDLTCRSPQESLHIYQGNRPKDFKESDQLFDEKLFRSPVFQRPFQYFLRMEQESDLTDVEPYNVEGNPQICLDLMLRHCGVRDPSWSEIHHFVWFLNTQLEAFEENNFVSPAAAEHLPGFAKFLLRFLILMSRDFSTRSLNISEESPGLEQGKQENDEQMYDENAENAENAAELQQYQMRRTWESSPHPYLFFNSDRATFTFLGFFIDRKSGDLVDLQTRTVLEEGIMTEVLYKALERNRAPLQEDFDSLPRAEKIMKLCMVMGIEMEHDPDDTYELTTDNVKKMLAIYMRFRCDIPVIIMGETGCGKTTLIKFMCSLQMPPGLPTTNMILMKVHGGTTREDIIRNVEEAERIAQENLENYGPNMYTVLFFDEANTTEAIGLIKEIMCDKSLEGKKLKLCENLKMVAACNPYRKHAKELIKKLEQAGLGYHVDADETTDRLGRLPMRRLVYRVQPLPQSLLPLVWDFGQLNTVVEDLYIRQMVKRYINKGLLPDVPRLTEVVSAILTASQYYMRQQKDECSFVSLRDVERVLSVMNWFYEQSQGERILYNHMDGKMYGNLIPVLNEEVQVEENVGEILGENADANERVDDLTRSLILALGVCYHACLKKRKDYRHYIARYFRLPCRLPNGSEQIKAEIESCQDVFLDNVHLEKNIARNMALKENIFMMVVCIELRIPLFLVGKPGSSKSLAKTIVSDAMQGNAAREELFRNLKQAQMVSFQCSPLSTPDGIVGTFRQCAQFQKEKNLDTFVSIVVLDEVGLAEDSPRMPLKTLHPLLEDGCQGNEKPEKYKKVAFIGISNWALDPAKMNRGILVQREVPDLKELKNSARGICRTDQELGNLIKPFIEPMAISYLDLFETASKQMREFYGLRDFYSLVKMVFRFVEKAKRKPTWHEMQHAIKRNFGGLDQVDPIGSFKKNLAAVDFGESSGKNPDCSPAGLIDACLFDTYKMSSESRYLLLLTENYGALNIVQQQILSKSSRPIVIFGSSFRSDQEYTQVCRNINKIKICMETGNTVVLLNLENLYESLYDALNQYYVYFGGARYVDLGLGTHRVKCLVHENFRLIVVAEKQTVYKKFPIPLINRLEKHFLTTSTLLSTEQIELVTILEDWTRRFSVQRGLPYLHRGNKEGTMRVQDVFIGYHEDTCSSIILDICEKNKIREDNLDSAKVLDEAKSVLLWSATPDSVMRLRNSDLPNEEKLVMKDLYFKEQAHESLMHYLNSSFGKLEDGKQLFAQVTTHSKLLASFNKVHISEATGLQEEKILLLETLSSFDTEQQFSNKIRHHLQNVNKDMSLMVIQCDAGDINVNLVACARYCVLDELEKMRDELRAPVHIVFIVQLPRNATFPSFQCGFWHSAHIDDLFPEDTKMPCVQDMIGRSAATLLKEALLKDTDNESLKERADVPEEGDKNVLPSAEPSEEEISESNGNESQKSDVLKLDDVFLDIQSIETSQSQTSERKLNLKAVILSCVQSALSVVKDKVENSGRETDRVALLLKLLQQVTEGVNMKSFLHGVCCLIVKMLEEKELEAVSGMAQDWLIIEAADLDNISKTGTFRRSCVQILENKVSPIFANIIAHLDTNGNLDILDDDRSGWKQELWLALLHTPEALSLQYSAFKKTNDSEVVVMTTGCEGHIFSTHMPFSWILIRQIAEILQLEDPTYHGAGDKASRAESYERVLSKQPFHTVLSSVIQTPDAADVVNDYIHDFVHCVYNPGSEDEHQMVCMTVADAAKQLSDEGALTSLLLTLINVHLAHEGLASRLTYLREMNRHYPDCSTTILQMKRNTPDHFMFKEQEFILPAVCMLIEKLSPQKSELDQSEGRINWLNKVHVYRPVVEKVIDLYRDEQHYEAYRFQTLRRAKGLWSRVLVVKLFLEHVCTEDRKQKITVKYCMPLWATLGEETDMKEMNSFGKVERFLKSCNKGALKEYLGGEEKCSHCELVLEGPPVTLPCKDVLCEECYEDVKALGRYECIKCHQVVPAGFKYETHIIAGNDQEKLRDYQKRCNTFFMDVVSQLCFADNTVPTTEVVDRLLGYIFFQTSGKIQRTRDWTVFSTGIDPSPVFRSFLLQLLIRTSKDNISENLGKYLRQARTLISGDPEDQERHYIELSLLIIQCLEDMFTEQASAMNENETYFVTLSLQRARQTIESPELSADKLCGLASARMGLAKAAKCIAEIVTNGDSQRPVPASMRKVIEAAQILCEDTNVKWTRIYLVKCLCRCYGVDVYRSICRSKAPFLRWIAMRDMNIEKVVEVSDRYIICGKPYKAVRDAVTKVVLGESVEHLEGTLQEIQSVSGVRVESLFTLAVHREVTSSYLYPQQQRKLTPEVQVSLVQFISDCRIVQNKPLLTSLIQNELEPRLLRNVEGEGMRHQGIQCLIIHFMSVFMPFKGKRTLLHPLLALMTRPQECANCFLPTMPQDDLEDVKEVLLAARNQARGADQNPVFYRCPNGHPYVIGNCGRPAMTANCRECGSAIGGEGHRLSAGNTKDQGLDSTMTGHILGRVEARGRGPKPERSLTPAYCASLRLLVHMAMYVGAGRNRQGTQALIRPGIEENRVEQFLWSHILLDVDDIHRALNLSVDDVLLFIHAVIDRILRTHHEEEHVRDEVWQLLTKKGRIQWETNFCNRFIRDILQNLDTILKSSNQLIAKDQRLGADPLLCLLYETEAQVEKESSVALHNIPRVWRYRTPISLQHLRQEVETKVAVTQEHRVLQHFLEEEHHLRGLRFIPSILKLQQALLRRYQKKLDKTDADSITMELLVKEQVAGPETEILLQDFKKAWDLVRNSLKMYLCPTKFGGRAVSKEYCNLSIDGNTPLSMLLPTENELGLCSYALLDFLMRKHNDFMDKYLKEIQRKRSDICTVSPKEVMSAHLISYDLQHDFLPLVLANCQYSFEMGKGTKIQYDFAGLERQLMDRFLFSKSVIDVGQVLQIDMMVYRTEITNAVVFKKLEDKIPQVVLNIGEKLQICSDIRHLPDLCQALDNLDITICFLQSTGGQPDHNLHEFMIKTLLMESSIVSPKAQQVCQFQHTKSLWLLLSLQKAKKMTESEKQSTSIFESVSREFHDDISEELCQVFHNYTKKLTVDHLSQFVEILHEFILLVVAVKQNTDDDDTMVTTDKKLGEWLFGYVDSMDMPVFDVAVLGDFPGDLLFRHSIKVWIMAYKTLKIKESGTWKRM